jgi:Ca2+-binding EF-hand superfamily protein
LDDFAEFIIHTTNQLQAEKLQNIEDIFNAADLNHNGVLQFNEFRTIFRILGPSYGGDLA